MQAAVNPIHGHNARVIGKYLARMQVVNREQVHLQGSINPNSESINQLRELTFTHVDGSALPKLKKDLIDNLNARKSGGKLMTIS